MRYEFKKQDAFDFASNQRVRTSVKGEELHFTYCPYCNGGKSKDKNSFAINLNTGHHNWLLNICTAQY